MSGYGFLPNEDDDESDDDYKDTIAPGLSTPYEAQNTSRWGRGEHYEDLTEEEIANSRQMRTDFEHIAAESSPNVREVIQRAAKEAGALEQVNFVCPVCNHGHGHSEEKHDIRYDPGSVGFAVTNRFTDEMEFNPRCHCGLMELSMIVDYVDSMDWDLSAVFYDAYDERFDIDDRINAIRSGEQAAPNPRSVANRVEEIRADLDSRFVSRTERIIQNLYDIDNVDRSMASDLYDRGVRSREDIVDMGVHELARYMPSSVAHSVYNSARVDHETSSYEQAIDEMTRIDHIQSDTAEYLYESGYESLESLRTVTTQRLSDMLGPIAYDIRDDLDGHFGYTDSMWEMKEDIPFLDRPQRRQLVVAGYETIRDLKRADPYDLEEVEGISKAMVPRIKARVESL